jgi:hypothetical protein
LQAGALDYLVDGYPELEHVLPVAARVAERIVGLPAAGLPRRGSPLSARERIAIRLADPYPRSSDAQLYADVALIDGLLMPKGSFKSFVRRQLIPPRDVLHKRARRSRGNRATSGVGHGARVLVRFALAMRRLAHRPAT